MPKGLRLWLNSRGSLLAKHPCYAILPLVVYLNIFHWMAEYKTERSKYAESRPLMADG